MADPWAEFRIQPSPAAPADDPWAEFRVAPAAPAAAAVATAPVPRMVDPYSGVDASMALPNGREPQWSDIGPQPRPGPYSGGILPFSRDAAGKVGFDSNAGILGSLKRAVTLPGQVMSGEIDPKSDEGLERTLELATLASPVNPAVRAGSRVIPGPLQSFKPDKVVPPTFQELKAAGAEGLETVRGMGVDFSSQSVKEMATGLRSALDQDGLIAEITPKTSAILSKLASPPGESVAPMSSLITARKLLGRMANDHATAGEERTAATRLLKGLDEFIKGGDSPAVVAGPASAASKLYEESNANYAAGMRSEDLNHLDYATALRSSAANSGRNRGNTTRSRVASLLLNENATAGFNPAEIAALEGVTTGNTTRNTARYIGNLLGGGGGLGAAVTAMGTGALAGSAGTGAAVGAGMAGVGAVAKTLDNVLTGRAFRSADELTRSRSPLYESMNANPQMSVKQPESIASIVRLLMEAEQARQQK